ncbi:hypothetical protein BSKO_02486 [Bryopsis sp. KO-2023]|nr:hypothetical protein BSKO_02486 [Bryopsis sp. KO-2023]
MLGLVFLLLSFTVLGFSHRPSTMMSSSPRSFSEQRILYEKHTSVPVARQNKAVSGGRFEVCKDVHQCDAIDPWTLDADAIEVRCTRQTKVKRDVNCAALWARKRLWGATPITEEKFFKMNAGFPCGENLVGRTVCLEATATIRGMHGCSNCDWCEVLSRCIPAIW